MKISFDFDCTLGETHVQAIARRAVELGHDVYVTTARFQHAAMPFINRDVYAVAEKVGIPAGKIRFTDGNGKEKWLDGFDAHFDDCLLTLSIIREHNTSIKLFHCHDNRHIYCFDQYDRKMKTSPAGIIYY